MNYSRLLFLIFVSCFCLNAAAQGLYDESSAPAKTPPLDAEALLKEYRLLYTDLTNIGKHGYKSFFDNQLNRASDCINISPGALIVTEVPTDFAILGEGFFKIKLENDKVGYTRNGSFWIDWEGKITSQHYYLCDDISMPESYLPETVKVFGNLLYVSIPDKVDLSEVHVGRIKTYSIPAEYLEHYKDGIYVIKKGVEYKETEVSEPKIFNKVLEYSNVYTSPAVLRMYYILNVLDEKHISNIAFKRDLLRMQVERMANDRMFDVLLGTIQRDIARINNLLAEHFNKSKGLMISPLHYDHILDGRNTFLLDILPYLKLDD